MIKPTFHFPLSHLRSTTVPLDSSNLFKLLTACQSGGERNWTFNCANRNGFSLIPCKMKCWQIDKRLPFYLEGSILRHDQASNKTYSLMYRFPLLVRQNFNMVRLKFPSFGIPRQFLFLQLNTAPLVSPIVEQKTTPGDTVREKNVTSKNNTNQNTTRTTHNDSVRQQVLLMAKGTYSLIHPMDD